MKLDNLSFLSIVFLGVTLSHAGSSDAVINQGPSANVRPMSTDRPDTTESAYTVPTGMFQVEASFFDYEREATRGSRTETAIWGQVNFKAGLSESMDLQLVFDSYQEVRTSTSGSTLRQSGFGDVTLRLKKNLWGNDEGRSAFALMPYVSIPIGTELSANTWQGGLIAPFAYSLNDRLAFGAMGQVDLVHDADTQGYDLQWLASATLGLEITDRTGLYVEAVAVAGEDADFIALFNTGVTYALTDNLVFDAGVRIGLNRPAPDIGVFSGISFRF
jgi:hypothetical protein